MVYTVEELMKRLANGESADQIADEMTAMLNAANDEVRKAEAEKAKREDAKRAELDEILAHVIHFLSAHYPALCAEATKDMSAADKNEVYVVIRDGILEALEKTQDMAVNAPKMDPMTSMLMDALFEKTPAPAKVLPVDIKLKSDDDVLDDFLSKICQ